MSNVEYEFTNDRGDQYRFDYDVERGEGVLTGRSLRSLTRYEPMPDGVRFCPGEDLHIQMMQGNVWLQKPERRWLERCLARHGHWSRVLEDVSDEDLLAEVRRRGLAP